MRILGIIPARGGSKGIPGKNIKLLNGKPLLAYTSEIALASNHLTKVVLSSDDKTIISKAIELGIEVPFVRRAELALDTTPTIDVIIDVLNWFGNKNIFFDAVCLLQVTSPFRSVAFLDEALHKFILSGCDSLISVQKVPHEYNPHWTFEINEKGNLTIATGENKIIPRRQELPEAFHRDGSVYITRTSVILNQQSLYGKTITYLESPKETHVNIDTVEDWEKAEKIARNFLNR
jgi:CMP-N,N'-diacetyllegionaminic acid synthase